MPDPGFSLATNIVDPYAGTTKVSDDSGWTPGGTNPDSALHQSQASDPTMYTSPTGQASSSGSWQPTLQGGAVWTPNQAPGVPGAGSDFGQLYQDLGIKNEMSYSPTQQGQPGPSTYATAPTPQQNPSIGFPGSQANSIALGNLAQNQIQNGAPQTVQDTFKKFMDWWGNNQPFQAGSAMGPNRAAALGLAGNPALGLSEPGQADYGNLYNKFNIPTPWVRGGTAYMPGFQNLGWNYSADLMRNNPGLFITTMQANQNQQNGTRPANPSPWLPPQLLGGRNPSMVDQRTLLGHNVPTPQSFMGGRLQPPQWGAHPGTAPGTGPAAGGTMPTGGPNQLPPQQLPGAGGFNGGFGGGFTGGGLGSGWQNLPWATNPGMFGGPMGGGFPGGLPGMNGMPGGQVQPQQGFGGFGGGSPINSVAQLLNMIQGLRGGIGGFPQLPIRRPPMPAYNLGNLLYPSYGQMPLINSGGGAFNIGNVPSFGV